MFLINQGLCNEYYMDDNNSLQNFQRYKINDPNVKVIFHKENKLSQIWFKKLPTCTLDLITT